MKENHVLSSPGTNKYQRSSLYLRKAVTSMVKLHPQCTLYDEILYKTHKIMNMYTTPSHHSRFYNRIKILSKRVAARSKAFTISHRSTQWRCEFTSPQCMHIRMFATVPCFCCDSKSIRPANPNKYLPRRFWKPKKGRPWYAMTCRATEIGSHTIRNQRHLLLLSQCALGPRILSKKQQHFQHENL
jgi:hypothetical protein